MKVKVKWRKEMTNWYNDAHEGYEEGVDVVCIDDGGVKLGERIVALLMFSAVILEVTT